jgi:hypothetical protein
LHEIGYVDGTQLCERDLTITKAEVQKIPDNWPVIYYRLTRQRSRVLQIPLVCLHMSFYRRWVVIDLNLFGYCVLGSQKSQ